MHRTFPKHKPTRSLAYRMWVASTACRRCGLVGHCQAAHPNTGKGQGTKTDDLLCFSLCTSRLGVRGCHEFFDQSGLIPKAERRDLENLYISSQQMEALEAGRPEFA